ncbi:MAG: hypothetical protein EXS16_02580 [Gemmataceae bacterium]|nr:hypothetical protein [Gemmataceae bacterium]
MLSDQVLQLLTAFVDGELNPRQREEVLRLLNKSSEARELVRQLQENANKLKQLPRRKVEPSLVEDVLRSIAEAKAIPAAASAKPKRAGRRWMPFLTASLAASIIIGVLGTFYYQSMTDDKGDVNLPIAKGKIEKKPEAKVLPEKKPETKPTLETPPKKATPNPLLANLIDGTFRDFGAPIPVDRPFLAQFRDLQKEGTASGQLAYELDRSKAVQLDITVKNNAFAMDRLRAVLLERGVLLVSDPTASKKLRDKNQAKVEYLVFAENLTSDELAKIMGELSQTVVVGQKSTERQEPSPYQKVAVSKLAGDDRQKVAKLLGVEAAMLEPKDGKLVKPTPTPKIERQAVLLPANPSAGMSNEVRQFAAGRQLPRPGTLQVLIRIHQE